MPTTADKENQENKKKERKNIGSANNTFYVFVNEEKEKTPTIEDFINEIFKENGK